MNGAKKIIDVVGAGPAGLVAAINLAKAGFAVTLHESASSVGLGFTGTFRGSRTGEKKAVGTVSHKGNVYYFCSANCKAQSEKAPEKYAAK